MATGQGSKSPRMGSDPRDRFDAIFHGTSQTRSVGAASAQSAAVGANTTLVRLFATVDTWVHFGANPTAVTTGTSIYLPAGVVEYFGCAGSDKIAALAATAATGNLYITEGA